MALKDLRTILKEGHELPIGGKTYTVPLVSAQTGLKFQAFVNIAGKAQKGGDDYKPTNEDELVLTDVQELDLFKDVLHSGLLEQMIEDGLRFEEIKMAAMYALLYAIAGEEKADAYWGAAGKAPAPNRAARRTGTRTSTGAGTTTRKRASRTGTSTPKGTPKTA